MYKKHKVGIWLSSVITIIGVILLSIYKIFAPALEASIAVKQLNDSVVTYSLVQKIIVGGLFPNTIIILTLLLVTVCLIPLLKSVFKKFKEEIEDEKI